MQSQLHIPLGIRFQCTACGHCCHEYPVPLTEGDVSRLKAVEGAVAERTISPLSVSERSQSGLAAFSYALDKPGGTCSFLTEDKRCSLHETAKPSMCSLFPYTFMYCPDGLKVGLSFASTGVLLNSGAYLVDQQPLLKDMGDLFDSMHPDISQSSLEKWGRSEFVAGSVLDYDNFLEFNQPYLARLEKLIDLRHGEGQRADKTQAVDKAQSVLSDMFDVLCRSLPSQMLSPLSRQFPHLSPHKLDHYILMPLYRAYFGAAAPVREDEITAAVMTYLHNDERELYFIVGERKISFADLRDTKIAPLTDQEQDLINRFVYVRLFSRLYFGPGFSMMPLLSGIFHLTSLVSLLTLVLKIDALTGNERGQRFERVVHLVREIDRRLTAVIYSRNTCSMFELFALDPDRVRRFLVLTN